MIRLQQARLFQVQCVEMCRLQISPVQHGLIDAHQFRIGILPAFPGILPATIADIVGTQYAQGDTQPGIQFDALAITIHRGFFVT